MFVSVSGLAMELRVYLFMDLGTMCAFLWVPGFGGSVSFLFRGSDFRLVAFGFFRV